MPSANRLGYLVEQAVADEFGLRTDGVHTSWCDAVDSDGTPVEIKGAKASYSDGREGKFRVFEEYHRRLQAENGHYVFCPYRVRGRGIQPLKFRRVHASKLPGSAWYGAGGHRESQQRELRVSEVFG